MKFFRDPLFLIVVAPVIVAMLVVGALAIVYMTVGLPWIAS